MCGGWKQTMPSLPYEWKGAQAAALKISIPLFLSSTSFCPGYCYRSGSARFHPLGRCLVGNDIEFMSRHFLQLLYAHLPLCLFIILYFRCEFSTGVTSLETRVFSFAPRSGTGARQTLLSPGQHPLSHYSHPAFSAEIAKKGGAISIHHGYGSH